MLSEQRESLLYSALREFSLGSCLICPDLLPCKHSSWLSVKFIIRRGSYKAVLTLLTVHFIFFNNHYTVVFISTFFYVYISILYFYSTDAHLHIMLLKCDAVSIDMML